MITFLEGVLEEKTPTRIVLNVQGVGYEVLVPLCTYDGLPVCGQTCRVLTHDHVREEAHILFGFLESVHREMFTRLLSISGIGPKLALSALSGMSVRDLKTAVVSGDIKMISTISGVGKKMAERIVVELRDKLSAAEALETSGSEGKQLTEADITSRDAVMALISLGYKQMDAWKMVRKVTEHEITDDTVEKIVRRALTR